MNTLLPNTLYVRNIEQAACMFELDGQLSDGHWENSRPYDHWRVWCNSKVVVAEQGSPVGRTFSALKDNYNLNASSLLDCVGQRMLGIIRIARVFGLDLASKLEHSIDCSGEFDYDDVVKMESLAKDGAPKKYWKDKLEFYGTLDVPGIKNALKNESYTRKNMIKDLKDLKTIFQTRLTPAE
jgi:hypothetical protein